MEVQKLHEVLEKSPGAVEEALRALLEARRATERVYAVQYLKFKFADGKTYSIDDAKQMAIASEPYDQAKAREIECEATYRGRYEQLINVRKQSELIARGI